MAGGPDPRGGAPHVGVTCGAFDVVLDPSLKFVLVLPSLSVPYHSSIHEIDRDQPSLTSFIRPEAAPHPFTRLFHESSFYRIGVHVLQLLSNLLRAIHVEIVEPRLPESW